MKMEYTASGRVVSIEEISVLMDSMFQYLETLEENDHVPVEFRVNLCEMLNL